MSASRTQSLIPLVVKVIRIAVMASIVDLPGLNPNEFASKRHSHSGSSASFTMACITRSFTVGIPSGRSFSFAFGIRTRITGFRRVNHHAVHPRSVPTTILLGHLTDRKQLRGLRAHKELLSATIATQ